jgi:nitroreductase
MVDKTELLSLHSAIFHRKSVRKYEATPFSQERLDDIMARTGELVPLKDDAGVGFCILDPKQVKGVVSAKAPHFLAVYADHSEGSRTNAAFMLQQMDLWFSSRGVGSCWQGMPSPVASAANLDGMPFVIMLAFGTAAEDVNRQELSEFKRKPLPELTNLSGMSWLLEPARLAPSGVNRQPWYFSGNVRYLRLFAKKNNLLSKAMFGETPGVDAGIALCHLWLAAVHENKFSAFDREENCGEVPRGYSYIWTVRLIH